MARANVEFLFRDSPFEYFLNIPLDLLADPFCVSMRADDPAEIVVGIATIVKPLVLTVKGVSAWEVSTQSLERFALSLNFLKFVFSFLLSLQGIPFLSEASNGISVSLIGVVRLAPFSLIALFFRPAHEPVQFVKVDVGEHWRDHGPLRYPAVGFVLGPFLQVASIEHGLDESQKALIRNFLPE